MTYQEMNDTVNAELHKVDDHFSCHRCPLCQEPTNLIDLRPYKVIDDAQVVETHFACVECIGGLEEKEPVVVSRPFAGHESKGVAS